MCVTYGFLSQIFLHEGNASWWGELSIDCSQHLIYS